MDPGIWRDAKEVCAEFGLNVPRSILASWLSSFVLEVAFEIAALNLGEDMAQSVSRIRLRQKLSECLRRPFLEAMLFSTEMIDKDLLKRLGGKERALFSLFVFDGLSHEDCASCLSFPSKEDEAYVSLVNGLLLSLTEMVSKSIERRNSVHANARSSSLVNS